MSVYLRVGRLALLGSALWAVVPAAVYAQASITGVVTDSSGAVLPGVTVEVESPALIERVRSTVTEETGRFRIEVLPPGTYAVIFTLPGFATLRREGIQLTGTFVAIVNADLTVGSVQETVTVTGEAPMVDVESITRQTVLNQTILDALPVGRTPLTLLTTIPGVTQSRVDVGGLDGDGSSRARMTFRGVSENIPMVRNISMKTTGTPSSDGAITNMEAYQEMVVDTAGHGVEKSFSGAHINLVPREGGNTFNGRLFANFTNGAMQGNNLTQDLQNRGLGVPNTIKKMWDLNPGFGGPILRDRLWFYWTTRYSGAYQWVPMFFNKNAGDPTKWTYEADPSQQVADQNSTRNYTYRCGSPGRRPRGTRSGSSTRSRAFWTGRGSRARQSHRKRISRTTTASRRAIGWPIGQLQSPAASCSRQPVSSFRLNFNGPITISSFHRARCRLSGCKSSQAASHTAGRP